MNIGTQTFLIEWHNGLLDICPATIPGYVSLALWLIVLTILRLLPSSRRELTLEIESFLRCLSLAGAVYSIALGLSDFVQVGQYRYTPPLVASYFFSTGRRSIGILILWVVLLSASTWVRIVTASGRRQTVDGNSP